MGYIVRSKQAQYIQKLLLRVASSGISLDYLSKFPALTQLSIVQSNHETQGIDMNQLLVAIGNNILTLGLVFTTLQFNSFAVSKYHSLKTLFLKSINLPRCTDIFTAQAFPKLRALTIFNCTLETSTFHLGDMNLSYLEFRYPFPPKHQSTLVVTLQNNKKRYYSAPKVSKFNPTPTGDPSHFPAISSWPFGEYVEIPYITFLYYSVHDFVVVNTLS